MRTAPYRTCLQVALALLALAAVVTPAGAQDRYGVQESIELYLAENALCGPDGGPEGQKFFAIIDADAVDDCDEEGDGDVLAWCACDDGVRRSTQAPVDLPDLTGYALLDGRGSGQTLKGYSDSNKPRLVLGNTSLSLFGDGATPPALLFDGVGATLRTYNGSFQEMSLTVDPAYVCVSADGLACAFSIASGAVRFGIPPVFLSGATPPTCDAALVGSPGDYTAFFIDTTTGAGTLCMCNGSSWSVLAPAGGSCG